MRYLVRLFEQFNLGVLRARLDYERAPIRACFVPTCPGLHDDTHVRCLEHRRGYRRAT